MRICHLSSATLDSHYFSSLGQGLAANGATQVCGSLTEQDPPAWLKGAERISYFCLNTKAKRDYPSAVVRLARQLRRQRIEILQTHLFDASVVGLLAARLAHVPVTIVARHYLDETFLLGTRWHVALDRWMAREANCVIVPSEAVRQHMIAREHLTGDNIEVIPYGFDFELFSATEEDRQRIRTEFGLGSDFVLGSVGRFFKNKGHRYLIAALKELAVEIPHIRLLLLGSGDRSSIQEMARTHGVLDRLIFAGYRKDVPACMSAMDLLVHPSLSESFGQVLVEAMAVGTAAVATAVGGVPEIVTDQETGLLVPAKDSKAIARAVLELYRDPSRRERLGRAGQRSVRQRFPVQRMVERQVALCRRYLAEIQGRDVAAQI